MTREEKEILLQWIEKADHDFIFTHNLDYLIQQCSSISSDFVDLDMGNLGLYAIRARYPHDHTAPDLLEATVYYQIASNIKQLVLNKIVL